MEKHLEIPLQKAIRFLQENGYRYAIIGGVALPAWGHVRATYIEALLIEQHGKLDKAYIDNWLSQFSEALENPDMLREYQKLRKKIRDLAGK